jgi:hypothetical protein
MSKLTDFYKSLDKQKQIILTPYKIQDYSFKNAVVYTPAQLLRKLNNESITTTKNILSNDSLLSRALELGLVKSSENFIGVNYTIDDIASKSIQIPYSLILNDIRDDMVKNFECRYFGWNVVVLEESLLNQDFSDYLKVLSKTINITKVVFPSFNFINKDTNVDTFIGDILECDELELFCAYKNINYIRDDELSIIKSEGFILISSFYIFYECPSLLNACKIINLLNKNEVVKYKNQLRLSQLLLNACKTNVISSDLPVNLHFVVHVFNNFKVKQSGEVFLDYLLYFTPLFDDFPKYRLKNVCKSLVCDYSKSGDFEWLDNTNSVKILCYLDDSWVFVPSVFYATNDSLSKTPVMTNKRNIQKVNLILNHRLEVDYV